MLATGYVLIQGRHSMEIWAALFLAFTFHQLVHILQGVMLDCALRYSGCPIHTFA